MPRGIGWTRVVVLAAVLALVATGCNFDWTQFGYGVGNTRATSDTGISQSNLNVLAPLFQGALGGAVYSSPAVAKGIAYVTASDGRLYAFNDNGTGSCNGTPNICAPLWTATIESPSSIGSAGNPSSPAVDGNTVYVGSTDGRLEAFSAAGTTNCSGTPSVCTPLWTGATGGPILSSPTTSATAVFVGSTDGKLYAFDKAGITSCTTGPVVCQPLWTGTTAGAIDDSPALSGSTIYVGSTDGDVYAFNAAGTTNCSGTPTMCTPLWRGITGAAITTSSPAAAGGFVYIGSTNGKLSVFDAAGSTGCGGTPVVCNPEWTASTGGSIVGSPAVSGGVVYIGSTDEKLYALDAAGVTNCSGSPTTCAPLWTATTGGAVRSSPAVTNGLVFVGSDDHQVRAFDAAGSTGCTGTPKSCSSLWSTSTAGAVSSSPTVAQGTLFVGSSDRTLYTYKPWTYIPPVCPVNPHEGLSPCQLQSAYALPSQVAGAGRTVAIVDALDDPYAESDLAVYRAAYGLPPCTTANGCFKKLNQSGVAGSYPTADQGWSEEISLDLDTVSAICPLCHIVLVEARSTSVTNLAKAVNTAAAQNPTAISNSYGAAEFSGEQTYDSYYTHPGIMITVSTGDSGYGTSYPSSSAAVTAVGGTALTAAANARGWTESAWSGAQSGCSSQITKPVWQTDTLCANRTTSDVSALAGLPGEAIYDTYGGDPGWEDFGGTSLASPIIASVYALAYPDASIASTYANPASLFDITSGNNGSCGGTYLCTAVAGYDGPTGLGTPCGTSAFGTGLYATVGCVFAEQQPVAQAQVHSLNRATTPTAVLSPVCGTAPPGHVRCDAMRITTP